MNKSILNEEQKRYLDQRPELNEFVQESLHLQETATFFTDNQTRLTNKKNILLLSIDQIIKNNSCNMIEKNIFNLNIV